MNVLKILISNLFKENFYGKRKNKRLMFLQLFSFIIKVVLKLS